MKSFTFKAFLTVPWCLHSSYIATHCQDLAQTKQWNRLNGTLAYLNRRVTRNPTNKNRLVPLPILPEVEFHVVHCIIGSTRGVELLKENLVVLFQ